MNITRLTISMPTYLYGQVKARVKDTSVSGFITQAVEAEVVRINLPSPKDPVNDFLELAGRLPKFSQSRIIEAIHRGRA